MAVINIADLSVRDPGTAQLIAGLGQSFFGGLDAARKRAVEDRKQAALEGLGGLLGGENPNYKDAAGRLIAAGDLQSGIGLLGLADKMQDRAASREGAKQFQQLLGLGGGSAQASPEKPSGPFASLIQNESGGRWDAQNDVTGAGGMKGHFGRLQFGQARLQEAQAAGAIPPGTTPQQFMASPELQKRAEAWHFADIDNSIRQNGFDKLVGQTIAGAPVTIDGLRAVAHLGGKDGMRRFVETGGRYNPADANGTRLSDYFVRHGGNSQIAQAPRQGVQIAETEADVQRMEAQQARQPVQMAQAGNVATDAPAQGAQPAQGFTAPGKPSELPPGDPFPNATNQQLAAAMAIPNLDPNQKALAQQTLQNRQQWARDGETRMIQRENLRLQQEKQQLDVDKARKEAGAGDKEAREIAAREKALTDRGLNPRDPRFQTFVLTGRMPREDQQPLSASDKKAILEADEGVVTAKGAIGMLKEAKDVSAKALDGGPLAAQRGYGLSLFGSETGSATVQLDNILATQALSQLKTIFGGAPTEGERKILLDIQGASRLPHADRVKIIDRAIGMAERRLAMNERTAREMRDQTYFKPGNTTGNPAQQANPDAAPAPRAPTPELMRQAKRAPDGNMYVPDPDRPGKFLKVEQ